MTFCLKFVTGCAVVIAGLDSLQFFVKGLDGIPTILPANLSAFWVIAAAFWAIVLWRLVRTPIHDDNPADDGNN